MYKKREHLLVIAVLIGYGILGIVACSSISKTATDRQIKKAAKSILDTPNLNKK